MTKTDSQTQTDSQLIRQTHSQPGRRTDRKTHGQQLHASVGVHADGRLSSAVEAQSDLAAAAASLIYQEA